MYSTNQAMHELLIETVHAITYLEGVSRNYEMKYLPEFTTTYNSLRKLAHDTIPSSAYDEAIAMIEDMFNKAIEKKLVKQYGEEVRPFVYLIDETKSDIPSKYVRYKIFGLCYNLVGKSLLLEQNNIKGFIDKMVMTYMTIKNMLDYKVRVSTELPITDRSVAMHTIDWERMKAEHDIK